MYDDDGNTKRVNHSTQDSCVQTTVKQCRYIEPATWGDHAILMRVMAAEQ